MALQWLRGRSSDVSVEYEEIQRTIIENEKQGNTMLEDLFSASCIKPLLILIGLMFFQQMSGINAVIFYTVDIFKVSISFCFAAGEIHSGYIVSFKTS